MTHFGILPRFIGLPLVVLAAVAIIDLFRHRRMPSHLKMWSVWAVVAGHIAIALIYTTPRDSHLVAYARGSTIHRWSRASPLSGTVACAGR